METLRDDIDKGDNAMGIYLKPLTMSNEFQKVISVSKIKLV